MMGLRRDGATTVRRAAIWTALALLALTLGGCGGDGLPSITTPPGGSTPDTTLPDTTAPESTSPETTQPDTTAPETTQPDTTAAETTAPEATAPETTQPSDTTTTTAGDGTDDEDGSIPLWVWILGAVVLIALFSWLGARSGSRKTTPAATVTGGDETALTRQAYADSRWLYDQLTPALAQWKGDEQHRVQTGGATSADPRQAVWWEVPTRMESARNALYRIEAGQPTGPVGQAARSLAASLGATKAAVDRMAAATSAVRSAESGVAAADLESLRTAEIGAGDLLAAERARLHQAITDLGAAMGTG